MDIVDRLKSVISYAKLSDRAFAIRCGLKQPTLDKQLRGLRAVSLETIVAIANSYPEISRDWLLVGEGEMLLSQNKEAERIDMLIDTIATLQEAINSKTGTIALLNDRIKQLENQLNK